MSEKIETTTKPTKIKAIKKIKTPTKTPTILDPTPDKCVIIEPTPDKCVKPQSDYIIIEKIKEVLRAKNEPQKLEITKEIEEIKKDKIYISKMREIEKYKLKIGELEAELENTYLKDIRRYTQELTRLEEVKTEDLEAELLKRMCEDIPNAERINLCGLITQLKEERPQKNATKKGVNRADFLYLKCPNGCGSKRNSLKGFRSHLGYGEKSVGNCRKMGLIISVEEDLSAWAVSNNLEK